MENLFASFSHADSIAFLISVLVTFLIGFITGWALYGSRANRYRKEADQWKKSHDELNLQYTAVKEQYDLKEADLVKAQRESKEARERLDAYYAEKAKWQSDLDSSLEESVRLQASLSAYQASVEDLNNQIIGLKARNAQILQEAEVEALALSQAPVAAPQASYEDAMSRLGSLEDKIIQLVAENEALRRTTEQEDVQLAVLHESDAEVSKRLAVLETRVGNLIDENDTLKAELSGLKASSEAATLQANAGTPFDDDEPVPFFNLDKEVLTSVIVTPSTAKEEVVAAIGHQVPAATAGDKDDLTQIDGIGAYIEQQLNGIGIYTYDQISRFDAHLIDRVTEAIEFFPGRIEKDDWVGQATKLAADRHAAAKLAAVPGVNLEDLKIVEGIGPKIEILLNGAGIKSLPDLASTTVERLKEVLHKAGDRFRIHDPSTWPMQAQLAAQGDLSKLKEYQDYLSGGREPDKLG